MSSSTSSATRWLRTGAEALAAMLDAIEQSKESIRLETYIYTANEVGQRFRDALLRALQRGVRVRVLVDALGSMTLSGAFWEPVLEAGGEFRWFNPLLRRRWSYRNHRKMLVCDDRAGIIGGFNISDEYEGDGVTRGWRDLGIAVGASIAQALGKTFDAYFQNADFARAERWQLRRTPLQRLGGEDWRLLLSNSLQQRLEMKRTILRDLSGASFVRIICAYFLPTRRLRTELLRVCRRGGRVQLILAGKSDVALSQLASQSLYRSLLRGGIEIYEYTPQILHAKLFLLDDIIYVGSANLDTRSLRINHELLLRLDKAPQLAQEAAAIFAQDLSHSTRIDREQWRRSRTLFGKLKENWAYTCLARMDPYLARLQIKWLR